MSTHLQDLHPHPHQGQGETQEGYFDQTHNQFQEGHVPAWDGRQGMQTMPRSTASINSLQSWSSADNSVRGSFGQLRHQAYAQDSTQHPQDYGYSQGYDQGYSSQDQLPPRGTSLSSASTVSSSSSSARYQRDSNSSNSHHPRFQPPPLHARHPHPHDIPSDRESFTSHVSDLSYQGHNYGPQQHQQHLLLQRQQSREDMRHHSSSSVSRMDSTGTARSNLSSMSLTEKEPQQRRPRRAIPSDTSSTSASGFSDSQKERRQQRKRREPVADKGQLPSLEQYEAMLHQMASPSLGPKDARVPGRRVLKKSSMDQLTQFDQEDSKPPPLPRLARIEPEDTPTAPLSLSERKLRRRSSLPSTLKKPLRIPTRSKRRNSGQYSPKELSGDFSELPLEKVSIQVERSLQPPSSQRHSWENDSVSPRDDIILAVQNNSLGRDNSVRKGSWQDSSTIPSASQATSSPAHETDQEVISILQPTNNDPQSPLDALPLDALPLDHVAQRELPAVATQSLPADHSPGTATFSSPGGDAHIQHPKVAQEMESAQALRRPRTPTSGSRPSTPTVGIRPPPGPPPILTATSNSPQSIVSPSLSRKSVGSGKRSQRSGTPVNSMLQPGFQNRPRAGSGASMASIGSFTMEGGITPPPSSPLPPPPSSPLPPMDRGQGQGIGLGIMDNRSNLSPPNPPKSLHGTLALNSEEGIFRVIDQQHASSLSWEERVGVLDKQRQKAERELVLCQRDKAKRTKEVDSLNAEREQLQEQLAAMHAQLVEQTSKNNSGQSREDFEQELELIVKQVVKEKDQELKEMMAEQDQIRVEMTSHLQLLQSELAAKEEAMARIQSEQENETLWSRHGAEASQDEAKLEVERLRQAQVSLEGELEDASKEVQRLVKLAAEQEQESLELRGHNAKLREQVDRLTLQTQEQEERIKTSEGIEHELRGLQEERVRREESFALLERELEVSKARLEQEEAQYRTLQDMIRSKMTRLDSQNKNEMKQLKREHDHVLQRVAEDHEMAMVEQTRQAKIELETRMHQLRLELEKEYQKAKQEAVVRERILRTRLEEQAGRNDQLEAHSMQFEQVQERHDEETAALQRTNNALELQLARQQLEQQELAIRLKTVEEEKARVCAMVSDLKQGQGQEEGQEDSGEADQTLSMVQMYESQRRQWTLRTERLERKAARAEEEARAIQDKNLELQVALEMAQWPSKSACPESPPSKPLTYEAGLPSPSATLSPL